MENIDSWVTPSQMVEWAKANLNIDKSNDDMTNDDIRQAMRWIGFYSFDTVYVDGEKLHWGRIGIDNMLLITMMVFPAYYQQYELTQRN